MNLLSKNQFNHESDSDIDVDQKFKFVLSPKLAFQNIRILMQINEKPFSFLFNLKKYISSTSSVLVNEISSIKY